MTLKKIMMTAMLSSFVLLAGCPSTPEEVAQAKQKTQATNELNLANPEQVGVLPDGRAVSRVVILHTDKYNPHYVYYVDNNTVSTNYSTQSGKTTINNTRVSLSENSTPEEIIATAERLKKEQKAADEAEFARLKQKLGQ